MVFEVNLAFGLLDIVDDPASTERSIPSWLLDRPDVIEALHALAKAGGTLTLKRAPDFHDAVVDLVTKAVTFEATDAS